MTSASELEELIAAPLIALVDAQRGSAATTYNFLMDLTEEEENEQKVKKQVLKRVEMVYERMVHDPNTGEIKTIKQSLSVPLITMLPIPYISIDEADINFDFKIINTKKEERGLKDKSIKTTKLYAVYASRNRSTIDYSGEMNIKIKVKRSEIPEGLAKMLTVLSDGIIQKGE